MAESAVSFILEQLSVVLRDERNLLGGVKQDVQSINDELVNLKLFLRDVDAKEDIDSNLKEWVAQLREISFDVEDVLDEYMFRFGRHCSTNGLRSYLKKVGDSIKSLKARHQIASEIKSLNYRLENIVKTQQRYRGMYEIMAQGSSSTISNIEEYDGRGDALFLEEGEVVGIAKPRKQLIGWIRSKNSGLEVIAVVGTGGLGKTTLVKKVYDDESVKTMFDRHVWMVVSDYKDVKDLLVMLVKKLVEEIKEAPPQGLQDMSIDDLRNFIYEFLKGKRYIIVLDDVWKLTTWEAIRSALPRKCGHGCILITTRSNNIGDAACSETDHLYNLMPLSAEESEVLFFKKAFPRNPCPPDLREFVDNILERCEGLPLAIIVIGGLLATKKNKREEWELLNRSLSYNLQGGNLERLWKSLFSLSYNDLPYNLKYCFLYLSIFPQGGLLEKEKILNLWIAEGFVQPEQDKVLEQVAEEYANELLNRSLIQVAKRHSDGRTWAFRVHDLLRGYITSKSREHNFVAVYNGGEMQWPSKIRRLAVQSSVNFSIGTNKFEHLRSLLLSSGDMDIRTIKEILSRCRLLKVLDLSGAPLESIPDEVFKLYHLKYLCLRDTMVKFIPKSIKNLQNLETLDLIKTKVTELPIEILELQKIRHLLACRRGTIYYESRSALAFGCKQSFRAPYGIGSCLQSLQTLDCVDADKDVRELGMLTRLRILSIAKLTSADGKDLCSSIAKLTSLEKLAILSVEEGEKLDLDYSLSSAGLPFLRELYLYGSLEKLPQWIPSLQALCSLQLWWCKLREDPLDCLQYLPNLALLRIHGACVEGLSFKARGFQKLKRLELCELKWMKWVIVENGSMPFLQNWAMVGCKWLKELPQGIEHLPNLEDLSFYDMHELKKIVVEEKRSHEDGWRLAGVSIVSFATFTDGYWSFITL